MVVGALRGSMGGGFRMTNIPSILRYNFGKPPPLADSQIFYTIDSSSLTDYIPTKIFCRKRLVRALGRLKVF